MSVHSKWWIIALAVLVPTIGIPFLWHSVQEELDGAKRTACNGGMCAQATAMLSYAESNSAQFPSAFLLGPDGKPWHSWRVLILVHLGYDELHKEYRFDEPWNGPNNSKLATRMPKTYGCPSDPEGAAKGFTNYFVVTGPGTVFSNEVEPTSSGRSFRGMHFNNDEDGRRLQFRAPRPQFFSSIPKPGETILLVESVGRGINWLEPRDLDIAEMSFTLNHPTVPSISSRHRMPMIAMADATRRSAEGIDAETLRRMCLVDPDKKPEMKDDKRLSE